MTNNLVPESRQDRNGKNVTRWVKSEDTKGKKAARIPQASIAVQKATVQSALDAIFPKSNMFSGQSDAVRRTIDSFEKMMPDVLERIVDAAQQDDDVAENLRVMIEGHEVNQYAATSTRKTYERALLVYPYTKKMMALLHPGTDSGWTRDVMFRMEKVLEDMKVMSVMVGSDLGRAAIMMSVFYGMYESHTTDARELWLRHEEDIRYIAKNLEAVEGIAPELMKRQSFDRATIQELISAPSKSLTSGIL